MVSRSGLTGLFLSAILGALFALGGAALWKGSFSSGPGSLEFPEGFVEIAHAQVGKGEFLFLPHRMSMWVVNKSNGKIIYYKFRDNQIGEVDHSRIAQINTDIFPLTDTRFLLSDRNLTSYLWVANTVTGDFQMWRSNRDGNLTTDTYPVPAGEDMKRIPVRVRQADSSIQR